LLLVATVGWHRAEVLERQYAPFQESLLRLGTQCDMERLAGDGKAASRTSTP
jgi:hypothetical protein